MAMQLYEHNQTAYEASIRMLAERRKGDMVTLVGSVHINRYEKDGQKRNSTEVKVEEIHFSGGKKNSSQTADDSYIGTENDPHF